MDYAICVAVRLIVANCYTLYLLPFYLYCAYLCDVCQYMCIMYLPKLNRECIVCVRKTGSGLLQVLILNLKFITILAVC